MVLERTDNVVDRIPREMAGEGRVVHREITFGGIGGLGWVTRSMGRLARLEDEKRPRSANVIYLFDPPSLEWSRHLVSSRRPLYGVYEAHGRHESPDTRHEPTSLVGAHTVPMRNLSE